MPIIKLALSMVIWGTLGFFVLKTDLGAIEIAFFRCVLGCLVLAPYCRYKGMFKYRLTLANTWPILLGGIFVAFNWVLLFLSFRYASITLGNVSYYVQPIFLLILGYVFFREQIELGKWFFIALSIVGVYLTVDLSYKNLAVDQTQWLGVGCALFAGFLYSLATLIVKKQRVLPTPLMTLIQFIGGGLVLLPFVAWHTIHVDMVTVSNLLIIGLVHTVLAFVFYYESVPALSTDIIAIVSYIDPIVAILSDVLFFNRQLSRVQIVGILLTLIGGYYVVQYKNIVERFRLKKFNASI